MSIGAILRRTKNFAFNVINFNFTRWHTYEHNNWDLLDAVLSSFITARQFKGFWANSTSYNLGDRVLDADNSKMYVAQAGHVSPATGNFASDRVANPVRWLEEGFAPRNRGAYLAGTTYSTNDIIISGGRVGIAQQVFLAAGTFDANVAAGRIIVILDTSVVGNAVSYPSIAEAEADVNFPLAASAVIVHGTETAGDGGEGVWVWTAIEPTHDVKRQLGGRWFEPNRYGVLSPIMAGVRADGVTSDRLAWKKFGSMINAFGGGYVVCPRGRTTILWGTDANAPSNDVLCDISSAIDGFTFDGNGMKFRATATTFDGITYFWQFRSNDTKNIQIRNVDIAQTGFTTLHQSQGMNAFYFVDTCENIHIDNYKQVGGTGGIQFFRQSGSGNPQRRAKRIITENLYIERVFYALTGNKSGDDWVIRNAQIDNPNRIFFMNITGMDFDIKLKEQGHIISTALFKVEARADEGSWNSLTGKVKLDFQNPGPVAQCRYLTVEAIQEVAPAAATIKVDFDIKYDHATVSTGNSQIIDFAKKLAGGGVDGVARGHRVDCTFRVDGKQNSQTTAGMQFDLTSWAGEEVKVKFIGRIEGAAGQNILKIDGSGMLNCTIEDFVTDGNLSITAGTMPEGRFNAYKGVAFGNFKSSDGVNMVFFSGQTWFRRLPDGFVEQGGLINIAPGATVPVTYPVPIRSGRVPNVFVSHWGGAASDLLAYDATTSQTQLSLIRAGGPGVNTVEWWVMGPAA